MSKNYDAIVIGTGPNGFAAAITLAQAGLSVGMFEAKDTIGGGMRSTELTLPGYVHDVCSAIHPLGVGSPFFRSLPLEKHGLKWIFPSAALAHPFDDGTAVTLEPSIEKTSKNLGIDGAAYRRILTDCVKRWDNLIDDLLGPLHFPKHPLQMAWFAGFCLQPATKLARQLFREERARGFFAGLAAHSMLPLERYLTSAFALILNILGHTTGWPIPEGGSQNIANALASFFRSLGGEIHTNSPIECLEQLPSSQVVLCDVSPKQLLKIASNQLSDRYKRILENYRYGPGVFKVDWALSQPIPWKAKECLRAGAVHLGGTLEEIAQSEREVWENLHPQKPYIILAQQSLFDSTRAPKGKHTAWGYCHVPNGSDINMTEVIEAQIERFAPGFKDCILAKTTKSAQQFEQYNPNYVGGDINGGVQDLSQLFTRPAARLVPYSTPHKGLYICSASTPPGGGVHGMCGYHAAQAALKQCF
ncbi:NAD(P)/FAD-dependent oxidoreductase [Parachlamydia sp. AcF125]|uniref:phytoene desaturase family protein n=1 Tax=Parachlamydia sp. AcF125 TaxID=2795736 RepID=UPI001BCA2003|nr:NAD(P)/FAD-dependent oxidoreductase [Parachlamydia sp. AcF125]